MDEQTDEETDGQTELRNYYIDDSTNILKNVFSTPMCSFSTPVCAARRSGLLARYSSDCCFGETLPRDAFLHLIAHWWPIHNARRAPAPQLFRLCQVGQYLEPGAICVRRRQWRGVEAARPRCTLFGTSRNYSNSLVGSFWL